MLPDNATWVELLVALGGVIGIGLSVWMGLDDVSDLGRVRREGVVGGPRWISARGHLGLNAALLAFWAGYTVIAFIAVHLPGRDDNGVAWSDIATYARLELGASVMVGQILQRITRTLLRRLPLEAWDAFFGEAKMWRAKHLTSQAALFAALATIRHLESELDHHREERRDTLSRGASADKRLLQIQQDGRDEDAADARDREPQS